MHLYKNIEQAIRHHEEILHVDVGVQEDDIRHAIRWVMRDNPDIFWFVYKYHFKQDKKEIIFEYSYSKEKADIIQKKINHIVWDSFNIEYSQRLTFHEKVMYVYIWLNSFCRFNINTTNNCTIEDSFLRRVAGSVGYAKAVQYLLKSLGIESRLVYGRLKNRKNGYRHCWNIVYIKGNSYHLDVCLGDVTLEKLLKKAGETVFFRVEKYNFNYFLVSTDIIKKTHIIDDVESLPICNRNVDRTEITKLSEMWNEPRLTYATPLNGIISVLGSLMEIALLPFPLIGKEIVVAIKTITSAMNNSSLYFEGTEIIDDNNILPSVLAPAVSKERHDGIEVSMIQKRSEMGDSIYSSIFTSAEVKRKTHMLVQVYLHLYDENENVKVMAQESDKNAERRDYIPLQCKLKKGDKVDVMLNIYGETLLMSDKKSLVWQGSFTKCSFDYFVSESINVDELSCVSLLTVNEIPVGEMRFITRIVESPKKLNPEIIAHKYNKVFISYAHKDEAKVKSFHEGLKLAGIEHFFDRAYLQTGDFFPQVIQDYINSADLFVLFWSENASKSEYVDKERRQALERAFPQVKPQQEAKLSIYPMSIEPRAELPSDMKDNYHFGEL